MQTEHLFVRTETFPSWFANALQEFLSVSVWGFNLSLLDTLHLQVVAGANDQAAVIAIQGAWRWNESTVTRAHPGGSAGVYDVYVTAAADSIVSSPAPFTDATNRSFALAIVPSGATPLIVPGTVDLFRKVGVCSWDGTRINSIEQTVDPPPQPRGIVGPPANYSALPGDSILLDLATPQTVTLPPVASCPGASIEVHAGPNAAFLHYSIVTNGAELIQGPGIKGRTAAGGYGAGTIYLGTPGSFVRLQSDGVWWQVIAGAYDSGWGDITVSGVPGILNPPSGGAYRKAQMRINGQRIEFRGAIQNNTGSTPGGAIAGGPVGMNIYTYMAQVTNIPIPGSGGFYWGGGGVASPWGGTAIETPAGGFPAGSILSLDGFWYDNS